MNLPEGASTSLYRSPPDVATLLQFRIGYRQISNFFTVKFQIIIIASFIVISRKLDDYKALEHLKGPESALQLK